MKWTIQKALDEGTAKPFIARLMSGMMELRDHYLNALDISHREREARRLAFDELYEAVLNEMFAMRKAAKTLHTLVEGHRAKLLSGEIVGRQRNAIEIHEAIHHDLRDLLSRFLNSAVRAAKSLQKVTAHLGLDIGGFFANDANFERRMTVLASAGHEPLVEYFRLARQDWSQGLIDRRNALEHEGWVLPDVKYPPTPEGGVSMIEPPVDGVPVSQWVAAMCRHVLAFVENTLAYTFQTMLSRGVAIVEIPKSRRDPSYPQRFRVTLRAVEGVAPWTPQYEPQGFE
ncbi:MAG: hypothetical protein JXB26_02545 [Candidatus Aminicenantes bacterium]|nr:hypothetical protein [Candidatus Aminicenantes bacterium]